MGGRGIVMGHWLAGMGYSHTSSTYAQHSLILQGQIQGGVVLGSGPSPSFLS